MKKFKVVCTIEGDSTYSVEIERPTRLSALESVVEKDSGEYIIFEEEHETVYIDRKRIVKFNVIDVEAREKARKEKLDDTMQALGEIL